MTGRTTRGYLLIGWATMAKPLGIWLVLTLIGLLLPVILRLRRPIPPFMELFQRVWMAVVALGILSLLAVIAVQGASFERQRLRHPMFRTMGRLRIWVQRTLGIAALCLGYVMLISLSVDLAAWIYTRVLGFGNAGILAAQTWVGHPLMRQLFHPSVVWIAVRTVGVALSLGLIGAAAIERMAHGRNPGLSILGAILFIPLAAVWIMPVAPTAQMLVTVIYLALVLLQLTQFSFGRSS